MVKNELGENEIVNIPSENPQRPVADVIAVVVKDVIK